MGAAQSNVTSDVNSLNWSEFEDSQNIATNKNDIEIIDIDFTNINSESESETINNVFEKLEQITSNTDKVENVESPENSPFISTEMYNKIMNPQQKEDNNSSPFINTEKFNQIMEGGKQDDSSSSEHDDSDDSTSDSSILRAITDVTLTSEQIESFKSSGSKPTHHHKKPEKHTKSKDHKKSLSTSSNISDIKKYGFSQTSSEMIKTSDNNYYVRNSVDSDTPYKVESSSVNTSDINLVSVDSRNGRRFI